MIVRTIVDLDHAMGLKAVAEGVEDEAAMQALETLGCDLVQAYLLPKPLTATDLFDWPATRQRPGSRPGSAVGAGETCAIADERVRA